MWQPLNEFGGLGDRHSPANRFVVRVRTAPADIFRNRAGKQLRLLRNHADFVPQHIQRIIPHVRAPDPHGPNPHVVETGNQAHHGGFSRSRPADYPDGSAPWDSKGNIGQLILAVVIGEGNMVEFHRRRGGVLRRRNSRPGDGGIGFQHLQHPAGRGVGLGEGNDQIRYHDQGQQNLVDIVYKGDDLAGGHAPGLHPYPAEPDDGEDSGVHDQLRRGIQERREPADPDRRIPMLVGGAGEPPLLPFCAGEGADHPHAGQVFPQHQRQAVQPPLHQPMQLNRRPHHQRDNQNEQRNRHDDYQRQPPVNGQRHDHPADAEEGGADHQADQHGHRVLELIDVVRHPVNQGRRSEAVQLRVGEGGYLPEHRVPHPGAEAL